LTAAAEKVCGADLLIFANHEVMNPVIEKMQERFRHLEAAALQAYRDGKTPIPLTFDPIEP